MNISAEGFKNSSFDLRLQKLAFITAANAQGKSRVGDAIRFALLGWVPYLGRRLADTAALLRGREAIVKLSLSEIQMIRRTMSRTEDGGLTSTVKCSWVEKGRQGDHESAILRLLGGEIDDVEQLLDIRTLIGLSPNLRAARLQALLAAASATPEELAAEIAAQTVMRLANVAPERMPEDYRTLMPLLSDGMRAALKGLAPTLLAKLRETGIAGVCEWSNASKREHAAAAKNKAAAAHELGERLAGYGEAAADEIARLEADRDRLRGELGAAQERNRAATARQATIESAARELERARDKLQAAQARRETVSREVVEHARDPRRLAEVEAELDALVAPLPEEHTEATELMAKAQHLDQDAAAVLTNAPQRGSREIEAGIIGLENQLADTEQSPWIRVRNIGRIIEQDAKGTSERVQRLRTLAIELQTLALEHALDPQAIRSRIARARQELEKAITEEQALAAGRRTATEQQQEAQRCRTAANEILSAAATTYEQARAEFASRRAPLVAERDALRVGIERRRQDAADADTALARAEEAHRAAQQRTEDLGQAPDEITADTAALEADLAAATRRLTEHARLKAARDELAALILELKRAQVLRDVFTALEWAAQQVRAQQVTEAGGPLKAAMRRFLTAAGRREEPFFHAAGGVCDLGWITPVGDQVLVQALSGAEWVLYTTALVYAMLMLRDPAVKVLLVDAGHCDDANTAALLRAIEAVSEDLTLALVEHYREPARISEAWQVIRLGNGRAAVAA